MQIRTRAADNQIGTSLPLEPFLPSAATRAHKSAHNASRPDRARAPSLNWINNTTVCELCLILYNCPYRSALLVSFERYEQTEKGKSVCCLLVCLFVLDSQASDTLVGGDASVAVDRSVASNGSNAAERVARTESSLSVYTLFRCMLLRNNPLPLCIGERFLSPLFPIEPSLSLSFCPVIVRFDQNERTLANAQLAAQIRYV